MASALGCGASTGNDPQGGGAATGSGGQTPGAGGLAMGVGGTQSGGSSTGGSSTGGSSTGGDSSGVGGTTFSGDTPVERYGQISVSGNRIVSEGAQPITLRGQGFGWDNWWPQYYNQDVVSWLASDWCVDVVRPAMGIEPEGAYLAMPAASQARIEAVVDAAITAGVYVIIDWHAHDLHQTEAVTFFSAMAEKYGDVPNVIYEIFNEPEDDETWDQVKTYAEAVIAGIRQHDPDNIIIVGSPEWDQRIDLVAADPITGHDNIAYSVHFYAATHGGWLRDRTLAALDAGIPVVVTESSGSAADGLGEIDYTEWEAWFSFMNENHVGYLNYAVADKEGETISILEPGAPSTGGWNADVLTESGEYVRNHLRTYCP